MFHVGAAKVKQILGFWDTGISPSSSIRQQLLLPIPRSSQQQGKAPTPKMQMQTPGVHMSTQVNTSRAVPLLAPF